MKSKSKTRHPHQLAKVLPMLASSLLLTLAPPVMADTADHRTDWFQRAGYGVFVHYLESIQNNPEKVHSLGRKTSWDECVRDFDTERFADAMAEAGAGYVIFTVMQRTRLMIAPNAAFDRISGYQPGEACATRDLIEDLYQSLHRRNIPLMLYWTGDGPLDDEKAGPAFGCGNPVSLDFVQKWAEVFREYGERYGEKIAGVWTDGCYKFIGYDEEKLGVLAEGLRAGHPGRIIALNPGVDPQVNAYTPREDYTCGEQNRFSEIPPERFLKGEQWHILSFLSGTWWAEPGTGYTKTELAEYVYEVNRRGGVVSVDVALFRDGSLDRSQIEMLKAVRHELETGAVRPPVPPGNLAHRKQAKLLSLNGVRELVANGGAHFARLGVDGNPDTFAQAGGEWPWTYAVDLVDTVRVSRFKVTFGPGHATDFDVRVSEDGKKWRTIAEKTGHDGSPVEMAVEPVSARHVRLRALKPDGPGQPGSQMAVAELEVYAE